MLAFVPRTAAPPTLSAASVPAVAAQPRPAVPARREPALAADPDDWKEF